MDTWAWIAIAAAIVVVLLLAWALSSQARRRKLLSRFGSEYTRTIHRADSRRKGERELRAREVEHDDLDLRPLSEDARDRYEEQWNRLQMRFVDRPQVAVADADSLLTEVMRERGYPVDDFDAKSRAVSVDHPDAVENYRKGHLIYIKTVEGRASTEDLRQAVLCYRDLFDDLVWEGSEADADAGA
jgi:hypothetical protein